MIRRIVSDSSCDLTRFPGADFVSVPLRILTAQKEYVDNAQLDATAMAQELKQYKGRSSTACPNAADWEDAFSGADEVFALTITSALSGSYNAATCAKENYESVHPHCRVFVLDTLSTGPEMLLLMEKLRALIALQLPFDQIVSEITDYSAHTHLLFLLSSVKNLSRNGRVSRLGAEAVGLLGLRLLGQASSQGTLELLGKHRGQPASLRRLMQQLEDTGYAGGKVRISHCLGEEAAQQLSAAIVQKYPHAEVEIRPTGGLCSFYAEIGGLLVGYEA